MDSVDFDKLKLVLVAFKQRRMLKLVCLTRASARKSPCSTEFDTDV